MWSKIKFITSEIGSFLWPLIKQFLIASAPLVKAAAMTAVKIIFDKYATQAVSNDTKHSEAYNIIVTDLKTQGLELGKDFTESMIDTAIAASVEQLKGAI